jgi:hypothetical protein
LDGDGEADRAWSVCAELCEGGSFGKPLRELVTGDRLFAGPDDADADSDRFHVDAVSTTNGPAARNAATVTPDGGSLHIDVAACVRLSDRERYGPAIVAKPRALGPTASR